MIAEWLKKKRKKHKKSFTALLCAVLFAVTAGGMWFILHDQTRAVPENPIQGIAKDSMLIKLSGNTEVVTSVPTGLPSASREQQASQSEPEQSPEPEQKPGTEEKKEDKKEKSGTGAQTGKSRNGAIQSGQEGGSGDNPESGGPGVGTGISGTGVNDSKVKPNKKLGNKGKKEESYFTTSIVDGETVTERQYEFRITHKNKNLEPVSIQVSVNKTTNPYSGKISLREGENTVEVQVTYRDEEQACFNVSRSYTLYLQSKEIQLYSDIRDQSTVTQENYSFTAYAKIGDDDLAVTVLVNGTETAGEQGRYQAVLQDGQNEIRLVAASGEKKSEEVYGIYFERQITDLTIDTDLQDQEVNLSDFAFYAKSFRGSSPAAMQAFHNGEQLTDDGNGNYSIALEEGDNQIVLFAEDGGETYEESYLVRYVTTIQDGDEGGEYSPYNPEVYCELGENGSSITEKTGTNTFYLNAKDYQGNWIGQENIVVTCNGVTAVRQFSNPNMHAYVVNLDEGYNTIKIEVADGEGHTTFYCYTILYEKHEGEVIGTIEFSVEATTVGSGYLVPPHMVDIMDGENVAQIAERVLREYQFTPVPTGTIDSNYYLAGIESENDFVQGAIPEDLEAHLLALNEANKYKVYFPEEEVDRRSLSEFDFCKGSGWMYSVNGVYPNVGMSDRFVKPGDVVRVRYTLYMGADIGGGDAVGNGANKGETTANWEKEW